MSEYYNSERQCCCINLNTDYNCVENYCNASLWNAGKACNSLELCSKYSKNSKNFTCGTCECCYFTNWLMCPVVLLGDIIACPCRSFLYCEKCVECGSNTTIDTTENTKDVITTQPI